MQLLSIRNENPRTIVQCAFSASGAHPTVPNGEYLAARSAGYQTLQLVCWLDRYKAFSARRWMLSSSYIHHSPNHLLQHHLIQNASEGISC